MVMEGLDAARLHLDNQDPKRQLAIIRARRMLIRAGVTEPGPSVSEVVENAISLRPTERELPDIQRFSQEQKEQLGKYGFKIYELTGQSILTLKEQDKPFYSTWHNYLSHPEFETLTSRRSEVAINPLRLYLPRSDKKTLTEQLALVKDLSAFISEEIPGVEAAIGSVADYAELFFAYSDETENRNLFGRYHARTSTRIIGGYNTNFATVMGIGPKPSLEIGDDPDMRYEERFAAPLLFPAAA
jgi:hypothetical protein